MSDVGIEQSQAESRISSVKIVPVATGRSGSRPDDILESAGTGHFVQFYEEASSLVATVAEFIGAGLDTGQAAIVIATEEHVDAFVQCLASHGFDVDAARGQGDLILLDAGEMLSRFMVDGTPDAKRFDATFGPVIERTIRGDLRVPLRMYGEMVDVLWKDGDTDAAIRVEELWNDLGTRHAFSLLCAYSMGNFYRAGDAQRFQEICSRHTHVIPTDGHMRASGEGRLAEIGRLQQRERSLKAEIAERELLERRLREVLAANRRSETILRQRERELRLALADREALLERERSARADAEHARARADEANNAKSEFLAAMSHELRTPLNAIAGYVQLVELGIHGPVTEAQRTALARVQRSQQHLLSLINDVLNFAKLEAGRIEYRLEDVSLAEAIADVACMVEPQIAAKGLEYAVHATRDAVRADREKLQQILLNLLSNAIKFTDRGGRVAVEVCGRDDAKPGIVSLRVADTGCGIPIDKREVIFDPFVQVSARLIRANEGTGLGLAISRELARGMSGDLRVDGEEGSGSIFTLTLPAGTGTAY
jgi:signal transduction histidine kinase